MSFAETAEHANTLEHSFLVAPGRQFVIYVSVESQSLDTNNRGGLFFLICLQCFYLTYLLFCYFEIIYQFSPKYKIKSILFHQNLSFGTSCFGRKGKVHDA